MPRCPSKARLAIFLTLAIFGLIGTHVYLPGLHGPWLVDDESNLGAFQRLSPAAAPYLELVFGNNSGPLGRAVSMATFAANHALGLFSTPALKTTNLLIHLGNGLLLFALLHLLFRKRSPVIQPAPALLAALLAGWWLLLPLHTSTVLYIVQRMTQVATFFSLLTCLTWVLGRSAMQSGALKRGWALLAGSLLGCFPLAVFAKESAFCTLGWLVLIEIFFLQAPANPYRPLANRQALPAATTQGKSRPFILSGLISLTFLVGLLLANTAWILDGYIGREFSLAERLLTEPRILWTYVSDIFLPNNQHMGLFQDDFPISRRLLAPWTTLLAIAGWMLALLAAIHLSGTRWWGVSFGILFYLAGHLVESTVVALELYFEHRNYLPAAGLLIASTTVIVNLWPWQLRWLALAFALYMGVLGFSTLQRSHIWGNKNLLLETSALNHPHSLRAWSDYTENLLYTQGGRAALEVALKGAQNNPGFVGISWLHMVSIYCRLDAPPPPALLAATAQELGRLPAHYTTPLSVGLQNILHNWQAGKCGKADLSLVAQALPTLDANLRRHYGVHYGQHWLLRFTMAEWLLTSGQEAQALVWLRELWAQGDHAQLPTVGLVFAKTLAKAGQYDELRHVLTELDAVTTDAPTDFLETIHSLRRQAQETP